MKQFGVMTYSIDMSQQGLTIACSLNDLIQKHPYVDPIVFYREFYQAPTVPLFSMMQEIEVWSFAHPVIATTLQTAKRLLSSPQPTKKFFYVMDLEWLYIPKHTLSYDALIDIYTNDEIELIARSQYHAELLEGCWKKPTTVIEDFNPEQILDLI